MSKIAGTRLNTVINARTCKVNATSRGESAGAAPKLIVGKGIEGTSGSLAGAVAAKD